MDLNKLRQEHEQLNKLQTEKYKKLQDLMYKYCEFTNIETQQEPNYAFLWQINSFISDFETKVIQSIGERKISAENHLKTLYEIQQQYGKYYFESIIYRTKVAELERNQFKFMEKIKELENENTILKKQIEF
jgi:hypothetical protein